MENHCITLFHSSPFFFINRVPPSLPPPLSRVGKRNPGIKTRERRESFTRKRERRGKEGVEGGCLDASVLVFKAVCGGFDIALLTP